MCTCEKHPTITLVLLAAGSGTRLGGEPKQIRILGNKPLWQWSFVTAKRLQQNKYISNILVVASSDCYKKISSICEKNDVPVVLGGKTRSKSVCNALNCVETDYVMIHDVARPFLSEKLCITLINTMKKSGAAIPVLKVQDSVKKIGNNQIETVSREKLYLTQTPQCFKTFDLRTLLLNNNDINVTDEATIWINNGYDLTHVVGEDQNFKITTQSDWERAQMTVSKKPVIRTGNGFDIHPLKEGRPLVLGGLVFENKLGLDGHSDADIVTHAVMDALLGAAGEPDIGTLFSASNSKYKNISSIILLKEVLQILKKKSWQISWIDVTLVAQTPKLGDKINIIQSNLNSVITNETGEDVINIKVKSGEECGTVGRSECMICYAVATISK